MDARKAFGSPPFSLLPRLVSEDGGKTWRIANVDDEGRADLVWDALFASPAKDASPGITKARLELQRALYWP